MTYIANYDNLSHKMDLHIAEDFYPTPYLTMKIKIFVGQIITNFNNLWIFIGTVARIRV